MRASTLGSCLRCQTALELGYSEVEPPAVVQGWYERGRQHEVDCITVMRDEGWTVTDQQREVEFLGLTGHLDGICLGSAFLLGIGLKKRVLEVKAPSAWARFEHAYRTDTWTDPYMHTVGVQLSCYMHAMGMEAVVASLLDGRVQWFVAERPPFTVEYLTERVEQIAWHVQQGERHLPEVPCDQPAGWVCRTRYLCEETDERVELDDPDLVELLSKDRDLGVTIAAGAAAEKERKKLREGTVLPVGKYRAGLVDLTVYTQKGRTYLDEAAMAADGVDVERYRRQGEEQTRWKVT